MADLKTLTGELLKLSLQIERVLSVSKYREYDDLSGLDDYKSLTNADDRQTLKEYRQILYDLEGTRSELSYFAKPVRFGGTLYKNAQGRYEIKESEGFYYRSGDGIEFLKNEKFYNYETDEFEDGKIWEVSRVESKDGEYYIVGHPDVSLSGLKVRVRY